MLKTFFLVFSLSTFSTVILPEKANAASLKYNYSGTVSSSLFGAPKNISASFTKGDCNDSNCSATPSGNSFNSSLTLIIGKDSLPSEVGGVAAPVLGNVQFNNTTVSYNGSITAVPEPLTILGASTAIAFGASFKNKLSKTKKQ